MCRGVSCTDRIAGRGLVAGHVYWNRAVNKPPPTVTSSRVTAIDRWPLLPQLTWHHVTIWLADRLFIVDRHWRSCRRSSGLACVNYVPCLLEILTACCVTAPSRFQSEITLISQCNWTQVNFISDSETDKIIISLYSYNMQRDKCNISTNKLNIFIRLIFLLILNI